MGSFEKTGGSVIRENRFQAEAETLSSWQESNYCRLEEAVVGVEAR